MASNLKTSQNCASAQAAALVGAYTNSSIIRIYDSTGTGQPSSPETAVSTQQLLAEITLPSSGAFTQTNGVMTAAAISSATIAISGTATWFRWVKVDGTTPIADGSVGVSGADLNINSVSLSSGATLAVSSFTYTIPSA
jgi:hypothetical protein